MVSGPRMQVESDAKITDGSVDGLTSMDEWWSSLRPSRGFNRGASALC